MTWFITTTLSIWINVHPIHLAHQQKIVIPSLDGTFIWIIITFSRMICALCFISSLLHLFLVVLLFFLNILSQLHLLYFLVTHVGSSINSHLAIPTNNILFDQIFHRFIKKLDNVIYVRDSANSFFIVSLFLTCGYIIMGILCLFIIMVLYWIWWVLCVWCDFLGSVFKIQLCYLCVVVLLLNIGVVILLSYCIV